MYSTENRQRFIDAFLACGRVRGAAQAVDIHLSTVYRWKDRDPHFALRWQAAKLLIQQRVREQKDRAAKERRAQILERLRPTLQAAAARARAARRK